MVELADRYTITSNRHDNGIVKMDIAVCRGTYGLVCRMCCACCIGCACCMVEQFFSIDYAGRGDLFENLTIWKNQKYRNLQGTYPVIFLSFADIKETTFSSARGSCGHYFKIV